MIEANHPPELEPMVTTVIPTYRRPASLRRAIDSVLRQSAGITCVAVYDNASGDETGDVVREIVRRDSRVHFQVQAKNLGPFENFRIGLAGVATPFFSLLSDDDLLLPGFYQATLQALRAHPTALFAATRVLVVDSAGHVLDIAGRAWRPGYHAAPEGLMEMIRLGHVPWTGTLFRREIIAKSGGFDPQTAAVFDLDFLLRLAARCPFVVCEEVGGIYVVETSQLSLERVLPAWHKMIDNIASEPSLSPAQRMPAQAALRRHLAALVFRIGRAAARRGDVDEAKMAARELRKGFGNNRGARVIELSARICQRVSIARSLLAAALDSYRAARSLQLRTRLTPGERQWLQVATAE